MRIRQSVVLGLVGGALGVAVANVAATAAVPIPDAKGVIRVCVKYEDINHYEETRWTTKTTCPTKEKLISWNYKGPRGPKGEKGDQGIQGIQGVPGDSAPVPHVVTESIDLGSANAFSTTALCPSGEIAIAGGAYDTSQLLVISGSRPVTISGQSGWNTIWVTRDGSSVDPPSIDSYATCIADPT